MNKPSFAATEIVCGFFAFLSFAAFADTFYWNKAASTAEYKFADAANWIAGTSATGPAADRCPGENDFLHYTVGSTTYQKFDLGGGDYTVKGVDYTNAGTLQYGYRHYQFSKGSLTFTDEFYNRRVYAAVLSGATFTIASTCNAKFGWSGAENIYTIKNGGRFNAYGNLDIGCLRVKNEAGGTVDFSPASLLLGNERHSGTYSLFDNSGEMNFPVGLDYRECTPTKVSYANENRFIQRAGVMTFGGSINIDAVENGYFTFDLIGGKLAVNADITMDGFESVGMQTSGSAATIEIAAGKTLNWSKARFASGTTLNVTGEGKLILGIYNPETLNVADSVTVERSAVFSGAGLVVDELDGWENSVFQVTIDFENCPSSPIFTSANPGILDKYFAAIEAPEGWVLKKEGNSIVVDSRPAYVFSWQGADKLCKFTDPAKWSVGIGEGVIYNPYEVLPGEKDILYYGIGAVHRKFLFDMDGSERTLAGFYSDDNNYNYHDMIVTNGSLTFTRDFNNYFIKAQILDGGRLALAPDSVSYLGGGSAFNTFDIFANGKMEVDGEVLITCTKFTVAEGGELRFCPKAIGIDGSTYETSNMTGRGIFNSGNLTVTNGLVMTVEKVSPISQFKSNPPVFTVRHNSGVLKLGGEFAAEATAGYAAKVRVEINGGSVEVLESVRFDDSLDVAQVAAGTDISWDIAGGKTLDLTGMSFGENAMARLSGQEGSKVVFGNHLPSALALDGPLVVSLGVMGLTFDNVEGFEDCGFEIVNELLQDGIKLVSSANPGFLASFLAGVTLPAGWSAEVVGNSVVATTSLVDRPQFSSSGEKLLSAADGWSGPALADGASVYVSGRDTVAVLDGSAPAISKITVKNGATLVLKELPQPMPELEARFDAKIVIPRGMDMELPPISAEANSSQIPVIEISTNATVRVADNYEFKNVHLDLFGKLQHGANVWFGTANPGETTYFGMRAIGATLDDYLGSSGTNSYVCPKAPGGRVIAPNGIYFKNVTYLPLYSKYTSCNVGNMNPVDEPFTMTLDGCYLDMRGNRLMTFGGAATILGVNGGGLYRPNSWSSWGLYGRFEFVNKARLVLEDDSYIYFMYNRMFLASFNPQSAGYEQLVLRNGSFFAVHTPKGNDKAVVRVENSYCDVMQLSIDEHKKARPDWYWDAFNGFKAINVPEGCFFGMRAASNFTSGVEWKRELAIGAPITGGGDLIVTNSLPGLTLRAIVKRSDNTASGQAKVVADTPGSKLVFADGSNWAGELVADENIAFTNLVDASAPATVSFGSVRLAGDFPIRAWRSEGAFANDYLSVAGAITSEEGARLKIELLDGYRPQIGDSIEFARVAEGTGEFALSRGWKLVAGEAVDGYKTLSAVYAPKGMAIIVR